jgi:hypothetical protein
MMQSGSTRRESVGWIVTWMLTWCAAVLGVSGGLVGCSTSTGPMARPVVIGASVSSGDGSVIVKSADPGSAAVISGGQAVGLARAIDACLTITHGEAKSLADPGMCLNPTESLRRQVNSAASLKPTAVFAMDALFWATHGPNTTPEQRTERLMACCELLGTIDAPMIVGNLPDLRGPVSRHLGDRAAPSEVERAQLNAAIASWAQLHPNILLLSLEQLVEDVRSGESVRLGVLDVEARDAATFFASDGLHLTANGELALATLALSAFVANGSLPRSAVVDDLRVSRAVLDRQREATRSARDTSAGNSAPGSLVERMKAAQERSKQFNAAVDAKDAARAADLYVGFFAPGQSDIRNSSCLVDAKLAMYSLPQISDAMRPKVAELQATARAHGATNEAVASAIEASLLFNMVEGVDALCRELASRAEIDREQGMSAKLPSARGFALRVYSLFVIEHPSVVVGLFPRAEAGARDLAEERRDDIAKLGFARDMGFGKGLKLGSVQQRLEQFAKALRLAGRDADAEEVHAMATAESAEEASTER